MTNKDAIEIVKIFRQAMDTPITEHREILLGALDMAIKALEERPQSEWGKWVISEIRCPECLEYFDLNCYSKEELNKCPSCGTDMRRKKNDD